MLVLACLDGSRYTASVADYAARAARRMGTGVLLLHVLDRVPEVGLAVDLPGELSGEAGSMLREEYAEVDEPRLRQMQQQARAMLAETAERVRQAGVSAVREQLVYGSLIDQLSEHEADAGLVIIGKRGESDLHATQHLGSNLQRVVRASHRPIMIVPPVLRPLKRFVVAYDGGLNARKAIDMLTRETLLLEAECHLLMVSPGDDEHRARLAEAAEQLRSAGYRVHEQLVKAEPGHPEESIIAAVEKTRADLLVIGSYRHSRLRTLILGSTTNALLRACTVPVVVIR